MIHRRIQQTAYVFIYPPWSRNHSLFRYNELPEPGDGLSVGGVAEFVVKEGLELRKEGVVAGWAATTDAEERVAAVLEVEKFGFVGELVAEGLVQPVCEGAGDVASVVETRDSGLAEHGVGVYVVVGFVDMVHVCPLLSADVWKADDFCRIQEFLDLIEVGVLVLCVYCDG